MGQLQVHGPASASGSGWSWAWGLGDGGLRQFQLQVRDYGQSWGVWLVHDRNRGRLWLAGFAGICRGAIHNPIITPSNTLANTLAKTLDFSNTLSSDAKCNTPAD